MMTNRLSAAKWIASVIVAIAAISAPTVRGFAANEEIADWLRLAVEAVCPLPELNGVDAQEAISGSWLLEETRLPPNGEPVRVVVDLQLPELDRLTIERRQFNGQLRQFQVAYFAHGFETPRPKLQAVADGSCRVRAGRAIRDADNGWTYLDHLDGDLASLRWSETIEAPWPDGSDPGGVRVAMVDTGLAYDLEEFKDQLARDSAGVPLGYDFWDLDPWPYDGDTSRGPFLPIRHGTSVASILLREAPNTALIPLRYPRPDTTRMSALVEHAVEAGARIMAMPLGSRRPDDWEAFKNAIAQHDILVIVSAGNDGLNIDLYPVYPAALANENILSVTSADSFGRLAQGSNWGAEGVDIMLPAENIDVIDFRGAKGTTSGSSYAVPRLAALAARILEQDPGLGTAELIDRIVARAIPSPYERDGVVKFGWIPDPSSD